MKLTGDKNQCPTCNEFFNSTFAFDMHRTGDYGTAKNPKANRRCMTPAEMRERGMTKNRRAFWVTAANPLYQKSDSSPAMDA